MEISKIFKIFDLRNIHFRSKAHVMILMSEFATLSRLSLTMLIQLRIQWINELLITDQYITNESVKKNRFKAFYSGFPRRGFPCSI